MHCDRCNVDFPEGLRYCKWCGGALVDRPRVTSELHSCPNCSAAIQPGWTFCKACGERLHSAPRKPDAVCPGCGAEIEAGAPKCLRCGEDLTGGLAGKAGVNSAKASVTTSCSTCGEQLDTGSLYCKGCGSAVYTEQKIPGGSALLCGACNSYSAVGSRACRVCGAPLQVSSTVVDFPAAAPTVQQKVPTLPDLDEHLAKQMPPSRADQDQKVESGANTLNFTRAEPSPDPSLPRRPADTNMLPGTAGSKSEQQAPTSMMNMGRITGSVDAEEGEALSNASSELANSSPAGIEAAPPELHDKPIEISEPDVQLAGPQPPIGPGPTTLGLGSESETENGSAASENKTAIFVSYKQGAPPPSLEQAARDDVGTRPITPPQASPGAEPTREIQHPPGMATADHLASAGQIASAPQWTSPEPAEFPAAPGLSQPDIKTLPPKKQTGVAIATMVVVVILIAGIVYVGWLLFGRGNPTPSAPPPVAAEPPPVTPAAPEKPPGPVVPEGMLEVKAGTYTIGRDGADPLEHPAHKVDLPAFFIDRSEVTNAAYKKFVDATGRKPPTNWGGKSFPDGRDDFPVIGVTWQDASAYAAWAGKRLPSEVEWEAAARGTDGRIYPWGNDWRSGVANIGLKPDKPAPDQYPPGIKEVGRYTQGASPAGAVDMIGNAWEWVADEIKLYPGNTDSPLDLEAGKTFRVIRGGAYDGSKINDATYRGYLDGSEAYPKVGFRCAKDAK